MNEKPPAASDVSATTLPDPARLLAEQRDHWERGERIPCEAYLLRFPALAEDVETALDLIGNELVLRLDLGERPLLEEFIHRFPRWSAQIKIQFEVELAVEAESRQTELPQPSAAAELSGLASQLASPPTLVGATDLLSNPPGKALPHVPGYEVLSEIARGGQSVVYQARQVSLNRLVALKMILGGAAADPEERARLRREAEAVAHLKHPHIVQIYDIGEQDGLPYLALEFMPGGTLTTKLGAKPQPAIPTARLMETLARAIHAAHEQGFIHRDLKPSNILLSTDGTPKISDFGLAKRLQADSRLTETGTVMGTPSYMAPEQAAGKSKDVGPLTDVYGLGAILYDMLTSRPPFRGASLSATLWQVQHDEPAPPRLLQPDIPKDLETICLKCLQKDGARRYASARLLADDLMRFLTGEPIHARPIGPLERAWKWARRKPIIAGLLAAVVAVTIVAFAGILNGWHQAERAFKLESERADRERRHREEVEAENYLYLIRLSDHNLRDGNAAWADANLKKCPERLRQWEWRHLAHRCKDPQIAVRPGHESAVTCVACSSDGRWFASADGDGAILIWNSPDRAGFTPGLVAAIFGTLGSPTGSPFAAAAWTLCPRQVLRGHRGAVNWIAFDATNDELVSGGEDGNILLWDVLTGVPKACFHGHDDKIFCLATHPHEPWVASTTFQGPHVGEILLWDRRTLRIIHRLAGHTELVTGLSFSPDGETLASASKDGTVRLWHPRTAEQISVFRQHRYQVACVTFSPDGKTLASATSKEGILVATAPEESEILVWDRDSGRVVHRLHGHSGRVVTTAFSPDGERLASAGWDNKVILWSPRTGQETLTLLGHQDAILSLAFAKSGDLISGGRDMAVRLWEAPSAK